MATLLDILTGYHQWWYCDAHAAKKNPNALRMGILSAANICPVSIFSTILTHPDITVTAVAARDKSKAEAYAKQYSIPVVHDSYESLVADPNVDVIYNPLPNGAHAEWTLKCIETGKHVLLEKPSCNNAEEAELVFARAQEKGVIVLEAFHTSFHPAALAFTKLVQSGKYGKPIRAYADMSVPGGAVPKDNIRWKFPLGGGCLMDSTYVINILRNTLGTSPTSVSSAQATLWQHDPHRAVDSRMQASLEFPGGVKAEIKADHDRASFLGFKRKWEVPCSEVEMEKAHYISIKDKATGKTEYQKHYTDPEGKYPFWFSTYRYQLEAFVDKVRGRTPHYWCTPQSSIEQMKAIDAVYSKAGLPLRPTSEYVKKVLVGEK